MGSRIWHLKVRLERVRRGVVRGKGGGLNDRTTFEVTECYQTFTLSEHRDQLGMQLLGTPCGMGAGWELLSTIP